MRKGFAMNSIKTGIQLYTVRDELEKDFPGTLQFIADQGIDGVEIAFNYGGFEPDELAALLNQLKLKTCAIYEFVDNITDADSKVYDYAKVLDCKYLTCGIAEAVLKENFKSCLAKLKQANRTAQSKGLKLCYHAHAYEFDKYDSRSYLEVILAENDLLFEADTAWIHAGGENVGEYLKKYWTKIPLVHLKDITEDVDYTEVGTGVVNFHEVMDFVHNSQVEWLIYEQDFSKIGALESTKRSFEYINNMLKGKF